MADITSLILDDHDTMRRAFTELDGRAPDLGRLADQWAPLAQLLEVHADTEEPVFYPRLRRRAPTARTRPRTPAHDRLPQPAGDGRRAGRAVRINSVAVHQLFDGYPLDVR